MYLLSLIVALTIGGSVGATLHLLRHGIDHRRGQVAEALAVGLPLCVAWICWPVWPWVELVFVALPIFIAYRAVERLRAGDQLQIADLFRLTTTVALALFVLNWLSNPLGFIDILMLTVIYLAADYASQSAHLHRNLASVFSLSFVAVIILSLLIERPVAFSKFSSAIPARPWYGLLELVTCVGAFVTTPTWLATLTKHIQPLNQFALTLAAWRIASAKSSFAITMQPVLHLWHFRKGVCYLNHGSFGAVPMLLRQTQQRIRAECEDEPLDFLARHAEARWLVARQQLAAWLGAAAENMAFCENATTGMNEIAHWFPLAPGDEVLINDHEYGAVKRIWQRKCQQAEAKLVTATLPLPLVEPQQITDEIIASVTERTKLVVFSHITSPTAIIFPVEQLCARLKEKNIPTCIDGPHALLQQPLKLHSLDCDFYVASCHKWLCSPLGSGFVYLAPGWHDHFVSTRLSWGRLQPAQPSNWSEELLWTGTRDFSAYLTVPHAIRFFQAFDASRLDERNHALASYARERLSLLAGAEPVTPAGREWFGWMVAVWLPDGDHSTLQKRLWNNFRIEVPIVHFANRWLVRVSCHLYNTTTDIDQLTRALAKEL